MSRKNRSMRCNGVKQYSSFASMSNATMKFDLSKGSFITKSSSMYNKSCDNDELRFAINYDNTKDRECISISIRVDIAEPMIKANGDYWACGIVAEGDCERFYMIPDELGYKLTSSSGCKRYYIKMPILDDKEVYEKYKGFHALKFDNYNKAYYITDDE